MSAASAEPSEQAAWRQAPPDDPELAHQLEHERRKHLLLDPRYPLDMNKDVLAW